MTNSATAEECEKFTFGEKEAVQIPVKGFDPLHGELYRCENTDAPKLLWLPAMGVPAGYYGAFAKALVKEGIQCLVLDLRGQGMSHPPNGRKSKHGYRHLFETDIPAALSALRDLTGSGPVFSGGHSLGGQVALLQAASSAADLNGLVFVATQLPHYAAYPRKDQLRMWLGSQTVKTVAKVWGYWPGHRFGFGGRQPLSLVNDWAGIVQTGRWDSITGGFDTRKLAKLSVPALAVSIEGDKDAPRSAVERLSAPLKGTEVSQLHYSPSEPSAEDHLRWARREPEPIAAHVANWVFSIYVGG